MFFSFWQVPFGSTLLCFFNGARIRAAARNDAARLLPLSWLMACPKSHGVVVFLMTDGFAVQSGLSQMGLEEGPSMFPRVHRG